MESMKQSGIQWIGEIPSGWKTKRIKYVIEQSDDGIRVGPFGSSLKDCVVDSDNGTYKIYGQANLIRHDFEFGDNYVNDKDYSRLINYVVLPGDILLSMMGTIGKCSVVPDDIQEGIMDSHLIKIRLSNLFEGRYFEYVYEHSGLVYEQLLLSSQGSIMNGLNSSIVKDVFIPVPSYEEQKIIADYLDTHCAELDGIIANLEKQIETLKAYKKSLISETVTKGLDKFVPMKDSGVDWIGVIPKHWDTKRVKYLLTGIKDGTHGTFDRVEDGFLLLSAKNVFCDGLHINDNESLISEKDYKSIVANGYPRKGDVLLSCVGTIGRTCIYPFDNPIAFQRSTIFMRPKQGVDARFLCYAFQSNGTEIQENLLVNKTAQDGLYMGAVQEIIIPISQDFKEQQDIANFLDKKCAEIESSIQDKERQLFLIQKFRTSMIFEYVTGKKRIKEVL